MAQPRTSDPAAEQLASDLRSVMRVLLRRLRAESQASALSLPEQSVLHRLQDEGPATTAALARAEWVTPQSMGAIVARLEASGHVGRSPHPDDRRCSALTITRRGRQALQEARAVRQGWLARAMAASLDAGDRRTLALAIGLLRRIGAS